MGLRDVGLFFRGRLSRTVTRFANRKSAALVSAPLEPLLRVRADDPIALVPLLEGRTNHEREAAVARWLEAHAIAFSRHRFARVEGHGENFAVEIGTGRKVLVLVAHHDAVPGSPGANDNAAAVAILLVLLERLRVAAPRALRVRLLFTAAEELGYLGARAYVADTPLDDVLGVLSLELCGIGDSVVIWDVGDESSFLGDVRRALERLGLRADEGYHVVGRIPVFGSDHRAFADKIAAYGLTVVPFAQASALRNFVFRPMRSALMHLVRRPPPFDTYHNRGDAGTTLEPSALALTLSALEAVITDLDSEAR
jgi:aminopeptidase YwaD